MASHFQSFFTVLFLLGLFSCKPTEIAVSTAEPQEVVIEEPEPEPEPKEKDYYLDPRNKRASVTRTFDLVHTELRLSFDWGNKHLLGKAFLHMQPYFFPQDVVVMDAVGFDINAVYQLTAEDTIQAEFLYDGELLEVALDRTYEQAEDLYLEIDYVARPYEVETSDGEAITSDRGLYFINADGTGDKPRQIWTQGQPQSSSRWFPTFDTPMERCTQDTYITVDTSMTTLSNGVKKFAKNNGDGTRTDLWQLEEPHAPYLFMIAVGDFAVVSDKKWQGVPVTYYVEPEYAEYAKNIFGNTPEMMDYFSELLQYDYPWGKYAQIVVRDYVSGAMENTTASVFMEQLQMTDRELIDTDWDDIIAHELFHQWFGDLVTCESWSYLTLNEAFASYAEYLWKEHKTGQDAADYWRLDELGSYLQEAARKAVPIIRFEYERTDQLFDNHSYAKGGLVLHMLRSYLGDEAFFTGLNYYLRNHEYSSVELADLRMAFEKVSGQDLKWFFDQWFLAPGHPVISVEHEFDSTGLAITVKQEQDLTKYPLFQLPVFIDIWFDGEKERFPVVVENEKEVFEMELDQEPQLILFDGDQQLVAEITHPKTFEELTFQYYNADNFQPRYEVINLYADDPGNANNRRVLLDATKDDFWAIQELAIEAFIDYSGEEKEKVVARMVELIGSDPKSDVRAVAIEALSSMAGAEHLAIYQERLSDSSYYVAGTALMAYLEANPEDKEKVMKEYLNSDNGNILLSLADHISEYKMDKYHSWFTENFDKLKGLELWSFVIFFNELNLFTSPENKKESISALKDLALGNEKYYVRLAATQGLVQLEDLEGVKIHLEEIRNSETDPELLEIYSRMF